MKLKGSALENAMTKYKKEAMQLPVAVKADYSNDLMVNGVYGNRVILCRAAPEECTAEDLSNVARYVPGYMCKGTDGSSEYAAVFRRLLETTDEDVSVKTLVKQLMIRIVGKDFPRQQVLFMLAGGGSGKNSDAELILSNLEIAHVKVPVQ